MTFRHNSKWDLKKCSVSVQHTFRHPHVQNVFGTWRILLTFDFDLVPLICGLWNALSTSGSSVHVYRFSTIFAIDRMWFGCMSMYSSWQRQLLLCESCFAEVLEFPLESFCVPTLHNPNVNMCPFAESSFWYQALHLFRTLSPWQEILTNPTVDNLLYFCSFIS